MPKFKIYAGLGGGFGGANYITTNNFDCLEDAEEYAYAEASQTYDNYEGLHGLRTIEDIMEEDGISDVEEAEEAYFEERENWLEYWVEEVDEDEEVNEDEDEYEG